MVLLLVQSSFRHPQIWELSCCKSFENDFGCMVSAGAKMHWFPYIGSNYSILGLEVEVRYVPIVITVIDAAQILLFCFLEN